MEEDLESIDLVDRIKSIMESKGLNPTSFSKQINEPNPSKISHIFNHRNKPSLELMYKILKTFPDISSEWLILGVGSMKRTLNISQAQGVLDFNEITPSIESNLSVEKPALDAEPIKMEDDDKLKIAEMIEKEESNEPQKIIQPLPLKVEKKLDKIIVYYSDNSFEEFLPSKS